jgi:hypothetical protein
MRPLLKYGIPLAGGLAAAGYAASQGEDPGSSVLAGLAGGAGAAGGLVGARLAGKYAPDLIKMAQEKAVTPVANIVGDIGAKVPKESKLRSQAVGRVADLLAAAESSAVGPESQRMVGKIAAGIGVPASAAIAGLGGVAAGAIPGAMGVPGFQQNVITDPELVGSSNTPMARASTPTLRYIS